MKFAVKSTINHVVTSIESFSLRFKIKPPVGYTSMGQVIDIPDSYLSNLRSENPEASEELIKLMDGL